MPTLEPRGIHRRTEITVTDALKARFTNKVQAGTESECWPWIGAMRNGYGAIRHEQKTLSAHVVAFVIAHGAIPTGHIVTHSCDNRICCNPAHLSAGTFQSNVREAWDRRNVNATRGECHPGAKLTTGIVRLIHAMRIVSHIGNVKIGRMLNLNSDTVKGVLSGKGWKHVEKPTFEEAKVIIQEFASHMNQFSPKEPA